MVLLVDSTCSVFMFRTFSLHLSLSLSVCVCDLQEVQNAERARRLAESEREELQDEVQSSTSKA